MFAGSQSKSKLATSNSHASLGSKPNFEVGKLLGNIGGLFDGKSP
jgi:hypothetical protein